jgi:hypothetical protein
VFKSTATMKNHTTNIVEYPFTIVVENYVDEAADGSDDEKDDGDDDMIIPPLPPMLMDG